MHLLVDLDYSEMTDFADHSGWLEWSQARAALRATSTAHVRAHSLTEFQRRMKDASAVLARPSVHLEWIQPVKLALGAFLKTWPSKASWSLLEHDLHNFWTVMTSCGVMAEVETTVSLAIIHVNACTAAAVAAPLVSMAMERVEASCRSSRN